MSAGLGTLESTDAKPLLPVTVGVREIGLNVPFHVELKFRIRFRSSEFRDFSRQYQVGKQSLEKAFLQTLYKSGVFVAVPFRNLEVWARRRPSRQSRCQTLSLLYICHEFLPMVS